MEITLKWPQSNEEKPIIKLDVIDSLWTNKNTSK